ncbi:hypothetical protein ACQPYA_08290 [Micromonospora sp. CA-263727]|uniref:hypothetical protein n=1 Tax=Micromonospora sp. CA-263727 TaxID=3239967 RepID=UPI003D8BDC51
MIAPRWIVHLPTTITNRHDAIALATALRDSLGHVTVIDFGETTLSEEDRQSVRTRVWCDAVVDDADRCRRRDGHDGPCGDGQSGVVTGIGPVYGEAPTTLNERIR